LCLRVVAVLLALRVLLRVCSVQRAIAVLTPVGPRERRPWSEVARVARITDALYWRRPLQAYGPCLRRSLTLYYFLTRLGYPAKVAFGVRLDGGRLVAHAWLTLDGKPLLERDSVAGYAVMSEWGGNAGRGEAGAVLSRAAATGATASTGG
jgi:hypothetical protein